MWKIICIIVLTLFLSNTLCANCGSKPSTPDSRFAIHNNGTVTDLKTGLIWKRCLQGENGSECKFGEAKGYTWKEALQQAKNSDFAGKKDWRIPNIKELDSIIEFNCVYPSINNKVFPYENNPNYNYNVAVWSSTPHNDNYVTEAWVINFYYGGDGGIDKSYNTGRVRLAR